MSVKLYHKTKDICYNQYIEQMRCCLIKCENAVSLGGDSDTLAAITGSIAEAAYGIPEEIKLKAISYLDEPLKDVLRRWKKFIHDLNS